MAKSVVILIKWCLSNCIQLYKLWHGKCGNPVLYAAEVTVNMELVIYLNVRDMLTTVTILNLLALLAELHVL